MKDKRKDSRFVVVIEPEQCKACGKCVVACPKKILKMGSSINSYGFRYAICISESCVGCGNCFYACPEPGAITVYIEDGTPDTNPAENQKAEKCQKKKK